MSTGTLALNPSTPTFPMLIRRVELQWVSDGAGGVAQTTPHLNGTILRAVFVPGTGGGQPANGYSVTLIDQDGIDVLEGGGVNLSNASSSDVAATMSASGMPRAVAGPLTVNVTGAGNAKSGTVVLYLR